MNLKFYEGKILLIDYTFNIEDIRDTEDLLCTACNMCYEKLPGYIEYEEIKEGYKILVYNEYEGLIGEGVLKIPENY